MSTANEFVAMVLQDRDLAHIAHWKTTSLAEHQALNTFYDSILELIDGFVEQYQGYYGERMDISRIDGTPDDSIVETLEQSMEWIETNRYEICDKNETPLQNTIDEVVRQYQSTLYMLTLK
jgi:hypothetical protein